MNYNKDQCLMWIKTPNINPKTKKIIQPEKATFLVLIKECKSLLTYDEVMEVNPEALKWIFPNGKVVPNQNITGANQILSPKISDVIGMIIPSGVYTGQVSNGQPHGTGELMIKSHPSYLSYIGEFKDGVMQGQGILNYNTGAQYKGHFTNGQPEGYGIFKKPNGETYQGEFKNGLMHGQGFLISHDETSKVPVTHENGLLITEQKPKKILKKKKYSTQEAPQIATDNPLDLEPKIDPKVDTNIVDANDTNIVDANDTNIVDANDTNIVDANDAGFVSPTSINYSLDKLTDANKLKLANKSSHSLITEKEFDKMVSLDSFMSQLLQGERKLLSYKIIQYNKLIKQIQMSLDDPLLNANQETDPIAKLMGKEDDVIKELNEKMKSLKLNLDVIQSRVSQLGDGLTFSPQLIAEKREKIVKILNDPENGINTLLGDTRENIRRTLLAKIISFGKAPELYINRFNNYNIMGPAGSGKTKLAGILGNFFYNLGILNTSKVIYVTRSDLVAGYIGQTAPLTRQYLASTLEGVLFIDEAYQLSGCPDKKGQFSSKDFGSESITEIVNYIDKHIGLSVVIGAGYEDKMTDCFLKINEGMRRRFPNNLRLIPYSSKDLSLILYAQIEKMFGQQIMTQSQIDYINLVIENLNKIQNNLGLFHNQAGDMLNLSNTLIQDLVLNQKKGYLIENINNSFTRFFISKGIQVIIKI
jgi:hypothetical protein